MIKSIIKRILKLFFGLSIPNQSINYFKTFVFNYIAFGWKGVVKLPVLIYGNTKLYSIGKIVINCELKKGLLSIGQYDCKSQGITKFLNFGEIIIDGYVEIGGCSIIENSGKILFKGYNRVADGSCLFIRDKFVMGEQSRIGFHSFVMDSDDHFTIDINDKSVHRNTKPIIIGKYNWLASNTFIKKGVITPDNLIVASNALLIKDYSSLAPYSVIGGVPAKLLKSGVRRIYNVHTEYLLLDYFKAHVKEDKFFFGDEENLESLCKQHTSKF